MTTADPPMPRPQPDGLVMRPFEPRDAAAFTAAARESAETVGRWLPWCHADYTEAHALEWFAACRQSAAAGTAHEFGIFSADGACFLGGAGLNSIHAANAFCNLGYWVRRSHERQNIATRCARALAAFACAHLHMHRVEIVVAVGNDASLAVARKTGAMLEGIARNRIMLRGCPVDAHMFSLTPACTLSAAAGSAR